MTEEPLVEEDIQGKLKDILAQYTGGRQELIPIIQDTQTAFRYIPEAAIKEIVPYLKISEATIYGVSTFYAQFRSLLQPIVLSHHSNRGHSGKPRLPPAPPVSFSGVFHTVHLSWLLKKYRDNFLCKKTTSS